MKTHRHIFENEEVEEEEEKQISLIASIILLTFVTIVVSYEAHILVDVIEKVATDWGVSTTFIGIILIPIVGNAAEHVSALTIAVKNKMDLALSICIGSATQIAVLLIPVCVLIGWIIGTPLTLYFGIFETAILLVSIITVNVSLADGQSTWLQGELLIASYIIISVAFFFYPDTNTAK